MLILEISHASSRVAHAWIIVAGRLRRKRSDCIVKRAWMPPHTGSSLFPISSGTIFSEGRVPNDRGSYPPGGTPARTPTRPCCPWREPVNEAGRPQPQYDPDRGQQGDQVDAGDTGRLLPVYHARCPEGEEAVFVERPGYAGLRHARPFHGNSP